MTKNLNKIILLLGVNVILLGIASVNADLKKCQKRNGNFPKAGSSCKEYYQCKNWIPVEARCPEGENFNANKGHCDWEEIYPCLEKPKRKECPRENGKFLKSGTNCKKYYDCCNGEPTEKKCPHETLFDPSIEKCEWSELYTCIESLSTTEKVKSTVIFTSSTPSDDQNKKTTIMETYPPTSTNKPSTAGITYSTLDPDFERTNSKDFGKSTSVFIESTATETQSRFPFTDKSTPSSEPTSYTPSTTNLDLERTTSDDLVTNTKMIPDSTPVKIQSTPRITTENSTPLPSSPHFSSTKQVKEVPLTESTVQGRTISTISSIPTEETELPTSETVTDYITSTKRITIRDTTLREKVTFTPEIVEVTTSIEQNIMCPKPFGHFPHPTDERKFVACVNNIPSIFDCPANLVYKDKLKRCDY